jgi:predicted DNA-binding transcriptional regulator AlpA
MHDLHTPTSTPTLRPEHEVWGRLGLSRSTWWRLLRDGAAPEHVRIGTRRFYTDEAVARWLDGRTHRAA